MPLMMGEVFSDFSVYADYDDRMFVYDIHTAEKSPFFWLPQNWQQA